MSPVALRPSRPAVALFVVPLLVAAIGLGRPARASAQTDRIATGVAGLAAGTLVGVWLTVSIYVTEARTGSYIYSMNDLVRLRLETLPLAAGPLAGIVLGASSPSALGRSALWGGIGFAAGAGVGALAGQLLSGTSEARWAGAIIGSGVGMLTGVVVGALRDGGPDEPIPVVTVSVPLGGGP